MKVQIYTTTWSRIELQAILLDFKEIYHTCVTVEECVKVK